MYSEPYDDAPLDARTRRKLRGLGEGRFLLYELTAAREMRVLHLPARAEPFTPPAAGAGRASRRAGAAAHRAP